MSEVDDNKAELLDDDVTEGTSPPDEPLAVDERLTAIEEQAGERFERRVAHREDQRQDLAEGWDDHVGTLVAPDAGSGPDDEPDEIAYELAGDGPGRWDTTQDEEEELSAEEAAMHLTTPPPMGDGDGYVDEEL